MLNKKNKIIKNTSVAIIMFFGYSNADYKAVIFPTKYIMAEKLMPHDWYGFLESDCSSGTITTFPDLNGWETTSSNPIICNGSSTSMPNVSDLSKLSTNMTIGSSAKFYNTENLLGLKGLKTSQQLSLFIEGEGVSFNQLENAGNVVLNLNEMGLKQINVKGLKGYQFKILGDTTNKSNVNKIIFDNVMYGYEYSPVLLKNVKNTNITTTSDSLTSMVFIEDSYINNAYIEKNADLTNLVSDSKTNYAHYNFKDSSIKNIILDKNDNVYLSSSFLKARTEPDSFYKMDSLIVKNSSLSYTRLENMKDVSRIEVRDSIYKNATFNVSSEGGNISDGIYLINDNKPITGDNPYYGGYFNFQGFNNINRIDLNDVTEMDQTGSLHFSASGEISTININNFTPSYMEFTANQIGNVISTTTITDPITYGNYQFTGNIKNATFNQDEIPYLNFNNKVETLTLNGLTRNSMISARGGLDSLILNSSPNLEKFEININKDLKYLEINDNSLSNNMDNIKIRIDTTQVSDHNVFKTLSVGTILIQNAFDGDFEQPFSTKFNSNEPFCMNYGIKTKLITNDYAAGPVPKSSVCN